MLTALMDALTGRPDYTGRVKDAFNDVLIRLVRFVAERASADRSRFPYLGALTAKNRVNEIDLQQDLSRYFTSAHYPGWEPSNIASGRADITIPFGAFQFVIEVKKDDSAWQPGTAESFVAQATAYQQTDVKLGFLAVLDLSKRKPGEPSLERCFKVVPFRYSPDDERTVVVIRVPGNKRTPSDQRKA